MRYVIILHPWMHAETRGLSLPVQVKIATSRTKPMQYLPPETNETFSLYFGVFIVFRL